ncbi:MAG TPA: type II secretion system protein GspN [Polyangiaceae bacterium]|jgi:type II secretion system protein N
MKERLKELAPKIGLPLFYLFCLFLFARWTFPYDKLRDRIVLGFNQQQRETGAQQELKIDELGPWWFTGLSAKGVHLLSAASEPGKPPSDLALDEARASASVFSAMFGHVDVSFRLDGFGGTVKGDFEDSPKERKIDVDLDSVNLAQIPAIAQSIGVPAEGSLDGTVKLSMPDAKASKATGSLSLEAKGLAVGDGKAKLNGLLALPRLQIGDLTMTGEAKDGVLKVSKIAAGGKDVELQGEGRIQVRESLGDSSCDLNVRFKINDAYRAKNDTTKSLFGAPGSTVPGVFELAPKVKQAKRSDGFYGFRVHGPMSKLDADAAPFSGPTPPAPGAPGAPGRGAQ